MRSDKIGYREYLLLCFSKKQLNECRFQKIT